MSWRISDTSMDNVRLVKSPNNTTVLAFLSGSYTALVPPTYINRLTDVGNLSNGIVSYRLTNITAADVGLYAFYILGIIDVGGQFLVIADLPSDVTVKETTIPLVNARYTVRCTATSSIVPSNTILPMYYQWRMDDENITNGNRYTLSDDGTELSIDPLQRGENNITLTCAAWQDARAVSMTLFLVKPIYGPENILLSPAVSMVTVLKDQDMSPVTCSAECYPECIFQWRRLRDNYVVSRETVLKLMNVKLDDSGEYICTANNFNTTKLMETENLTLSVIDPDDITTQLSLVRLDGDVAVFSIGYSLRIGKPRSLTLQYRAVTTFNATWTTAREILILANITVPVTVEVSLLNDQQMYSYRAFSTYEWGAGRYSGEIVIAVVRKAPDVNTATSTSTLPLIFTGSTAGIFFVIIVLLVIYILRRKSKNGRKTDSESRNRKIMKMGKSMMYAAHTG